ncbi:MAG: hypothetical protein GY799_27410 [Desulfobulbaceae bacterium]|nr:hypothetical protein [Desulfobulbaceae bacterium]
MSLFSQLLAYAAFFMFLALILYVIFGHIIVRKLRKNPSTRDALGVEFASGWDILNVAQALAIPRSWSKKLERGPLSSLYANSEILFTHTNKLDRILGAILYWLLTISGLVMICLVLLDTLGFFES